MKLLLKLITIILLVFVLIFEIYLTIRGFSLASSQNKGRTSDQFFVCPDGSRHGPGVPNEGVQEWCTNQGYIPNERGEDAWRIGRIRHVQLEGGFYGIITEDGGKLDPVNLPEDFKEDGLRIRFKSSEKGQMAGIHMWGTLVEILEIEELPDPDTLR